MLVFLINITVKIVLTLPQAQLRYVIASIYIIVVLVRTSCVVTSVLPVSGVNLEVVHTPGT